MKTFLTVSLVTIGAFFLVFVVWLFFLLLKEIEGEGQSESPQSQGHSQEPSSEELHLFAASSCDKKLTGKIEGQRVSTMESFSGDPDGNQSCYDCYYCRALVTWWCQNEEAIEARKTSIPNAKNCPYYLFDGDVETYEDNGPTEKHRTIES